MILAAATPVFGWGSILDGLTNELERRGLAYATLRESPTEVTLLVAPEDVGAVEDAARQAGLRTSDAARRRSGTLVTDAEGEGGQRVNVVTELVYGGSVCWLRTDEPEQLILRRAHHDSGRRVAALQDQLVDALLHSIVDVGAFTAD